MNSAVPAPRGQQGGLHPVVQAILATAMLVAALALWRVTGDFSGSEDFSVASGLPVATDRDSTPLSTATATPSPSTTSTPTGPLEVVIVTPVVTPEPSRPTSTPKPECPADNSGVRCWFVPPPPTPGVAPTVTPTAPCDDLRTAVASGATVAPTWCKEYPDE